MKNGSLLPLLQGFRPIAARVCVSPLKMWPAAPNSCVNTQRSAVCVALLCARCCAPFPSRCTSSSSLAVHGACAAARKAARACAVPPIHATNTSSGMLLSGSLEWMRATAHDCIAPEWLPETTRASCTIIGTHFQVAKMRDDSIRIVGE